MGFIATWGLFFIIVGVVRFCDDKDLTRTQILARRDMALTIGLAGVVIFSILGFFI